MKHLKHIILLLSIFALFGCKEKYCEGYFIYEVTGYTDTLLQHYTDKNGKTYMVDGGLDLGEFGYIYFIDWDQLRGRKRVCQVQIMGE